MTRWILLALVVTVSLIGLLLSGCGGDGNNGASIEVRLINNMAAAAFMNVINVEQYHSGNPVQPGATRTVFMNVGGALPQQVQVTVEAGTGDQPSGGNGITVDVRQNRTYRVNATLNADGTLTMALVD